MVYQYLPSRYGMNLDDLRTLPVGIDQPSACRHPDWTGPDDLAIKR